MPRTRLVSPAGIVKKSGDTMTGGLTGTTVSMSGEVSGATINNQFSNILTAQLLDISSTLKFLNTLTGTPVTDAANMIDVSGSAHDGTYKGTWAAAQRVAKGFGWVLSPNGTDNYISLGDSNDFSFGDGINDSAFTIAGVIEVTVTGTVRVIIAKRDSTTASELREWALQLTSTNVLDISLFDESVNVDVTRRSDSALAAGFHTFVITYSGIGGATAANGIIIYEDGVVAASTATNDASYVAMENTATIVTLAAMKGAAAFERFLPSDMTAPIIDKGTVWTAAQVNRFHQLMKGVYNI